MRRWARPRPVRWFIRHGAPRWLLLLAARTGNEPAQLLSLREDPEASYHLQERIRAAGSLAGGSALMATGRYQICTEILVDKDFEAGVGSSRVARLVLNAGRDGRSVGPLDPPSLLVSDPPDHTRMRRLVSRVFSPRSVAAMQPRICELTEELLDRLEDRAAAGEPIDLVEHFAMRLPVAVIADILALPVQMLDQILRWADEAAPALDLGVTRREFAAADEALLQTNAWLVQHFHRLRKNPGDDLLSELVQIVDTDGTRLSDAELVSVAQLLVAAGFVTIVDMLASGIVALLRHPDQLAGLLAAPAGWPNAVEEILRYASPVQVTARFSARRRELDGCPLPKGQSVLALLGAANRDPAVFTDPDAFDVCRVNAREHVAFSRGIHHCLGAGLARLEGQVALRLLVERFPQMRLAGEPEPRRSAMLRGYTRVLVVLSPAADTAHGLATWRSSSLGHPPGVA